MSAKASELTLEEREAAFEEAKAESDKIKETLQAQEQIESDISGPDPTPEPATFQYEDAGTRRERLLREAESTYTKVDTSKDLQTIDTEKIETTRQDVPPPRVIRNIGKAVTLYEKPFADVERPIRTVGTRLESEAKQERIEEATERQVIREREFTARTVADTTQDYQTLDKEDFTVEHEISTHVAPRVSPREDVHFVETQELDYEYYPETRRDVVTPTRVKEMGAAISGMFYGGFRTATTLVRPVAIAETLMGSAQLIAGQVDLSNVESPLFTLGAVGGSVVAGYGLGKAYSWIKGKYEHYRYGDIQMEDFFHPDELRHQYPQEIDVQRMTRHPEEVMVADELGSGFLSSKKYDPTGRSWPKSGTKGMGYRRTGEGLIQELIPEGLGHLETWYKYRMEYGKSHLPGIRTSPRFNPFIATKDLGRTGVSLGLISGISASARSPYITDVTPTIDEPLKDSSAKLQDERLKGDTTQIFDTVNINKLLTDLTPKSSLDIHVGSLTRTDPVSVLGDDIIQVGEVIQDVAQKQKQKTIYSQHLKQKQEQNPFPPTMPLTRNPFDKPRPISRIPHRKDKRKRKPMKSPLIGYEIRTYKYRTPKELLGNSKTKNPFDSKKKKKVKLF